MRTGWWVVASVLIACRGSSDRAEPQPAPVQPSPLPPPPAPAQPAPSPQQKYPSRADFGPREGDVITEHKPTAAEVSAMLKLDPAHDKLLVEPEDRGLTVWKRSYDGIPVLDDVKTAITMGKWHTRFHPVELAPEPVRRDALVSRGAALATSGVKDGVAELGYVPVLAQRQIPGSPGDNAMDYDMKVSRFELIYRVTSPGGRPPAADVDAYTGTVLRRASGIIVD